MTLLPLKCMRALQAATKYYPAAYAMSGEGEGLPYEKVMLACCLAYGSKSRILVSLRMFTTKIHSD